MNQRKDIDSGPILLISPDEMSLDHVLEGVQEFQDKGIARFGKESMNPELDKLNADKLKSAKQKGATGAKTSGLSEEQEQIRSKLSNVHDNIHVARRTIISAPSLKRVMRSSHFESISHNGGMMQWVMPSQGPKSSTRLNTSEDFQEGDEWVECPFNVEYDPDKRCPATDDRTEELKEKKKLMAKLRHTDIMKDQEVENATDIWAFSSEERWRLYRFWINEFKKSAARHIQDLCQDVFDRTQEWAKVERAGFDVLRNASLLGMTASAAVEHHRALRYVQPRVVIVVCASDVLESVVLSSLSQNCQQLIMIGKTTSSLKLYPAITALARENRVESSLFLRLWEKQYSIKSLTHQHRMRPEISKFLKLESYPDLLDHSDVTKLGNINGLEENVYFLSHGYSIDVACTHEARFITALCEYLMGQGYNARDIAIMTASPGQLKRFKQEMTGELFEGINIQPVDDFLGESDIVMLAMFQMHQYKGYRMNTEERLVKALTRARKGFYAIGNFNFLSKHNHPWRTLLEEAQRLNWMGRELLLTCSNHSDQQNVVSSSDDIKKRITDGGCGKSCEARLRCGHSCKLPCHKHDNKQLGSYRCEQPCQKPIASCPAGHKCTNRCHAKCVKKCDKDSERELPCGHTQLVPCSLAAQEIKCQALCGKPLSCGHRCRNMCGESCTTECQEEIIKDDWPCHHTVRVQCSDTSDMCPHPCGKELKCGHRCQGTCGSCMRSRLHVNCEKPCGRILVCGHQCKSKCSSTCPPCSENCQNKCKHSRCTEPCGETCIPCLEHCEWQCPHQSCRQVCSHPCDREPCKQPCRKKLKCGHECIGLCGEPCPKKCRVCNEVEIKETFFGDEDEPDARFVQLEDCGHVFEVTGLDRWMSSSTGTEDSNNIKLKGCPRCSTPIRKNLRYGNTIKRILTDIETVKEKMMGNSKEIKEKKRQLRKKVGALKKTDSGFLSDEKVDRFLENLDNCHHLETVVARLNRWNFLQEVMTLQALIGDLSQSLQDESAGKKMPKAHCDILENRVKPLSSRIEGLKKRLSDGDLDRFAQQQMDDVMTEIIRMGMEADAGKLLVCNLAWWDKNPTNQYLLIELGDLMASQEPLTLDHENEAKTILSRIREALGIAESTALGLSDRDRMQVVHAIGLSQGHWFKCKEGHIYAIGECGGAMEKGVCPECGGTIGGQRHRLTDENLLAGEMDKASHAAWSKEANE